MVLAKSYDNACEFVKVTYKILLVFLTRCMYKYTYWCFAQFCCFLFVGAKKILPRFVDFFSVDCTSDIRVEII